MVKVRLFTPQSPNAAAVAAATAAAASVPPNAASAAAAAAALAAAAAAGPSGAGPPSAAASVSAAAAAACAAAAASSTANQDLASLFECPVCFDYVLPPILQCHAGHLVCSSCRPKLTCCPTCRGQLGGNIRNLAMEKVASTVMFPCKYSSSGDDTKMELFQPFLLLIEGCFIFLITGCGASLLHTEKLDHEETCEYRPYSCPCPGASCKWQGSLEQARKTESMPRIA